MRESGVNKNVIKWSRQFSPRSCGKNRDQAEVSAIILIFLARRDLALAESATGKFLREVREGAEWRKSCDEAVTSRYRPVVRNVIAMMTEIVGTAREDGPAPATVSADLPHARSFRIFAAGADGETATLDLVFFPDLKGERAPEKLSYGINVSGHVFYTGHIRGLSAISAVPGAQGPEIGKKSLQDAILKALGELVDAHESGG